MKRTVDWVVVGLVVCMIALIGSIVATAFIKAGQCHTLLNRAHTLQDTVAIARIDAHCLNATAP